MRKIVKISISACLLLICLSNISAQERYVRPVDEGKKDKSFAEFRAKLIQAVNKHDKKYLLSVLDPNIKSSFGGDDGISDFKKFWKIDSPKSKLWKELSAALNNGGNFSDKNNFTAPYTFASFPDDLDAFEHSVIFGNNVNLRTKPDLSAESAANLSYNVVKVDFENSVGDKAEPPNYSWLKVETLGGKKGFVSAEFVRSPIDYRAIFTKEKGKWKMTAFVSGD